MGIPDHLTCLLRNLYAGQEGTVRTGHGPTEWFQIGKGVRQGCILSPCLVNLYAEHIMWNATWMTHQLESRLLGEYWYLQICRWYHANGRKWRGIKEPPWWKWKGRVKKLAYNSTFQRSWHLVPSLHGKQMRWRNNGNSDRLHFLSLQNHSGQWLQPWN